MFFYASDLSDQQNVAQNNLSSPISSKWVTQPESVRCIWYSFLPFIFRYFLGCEGWKTQVHRMFSSIASVVLPKSQLLLQCMKSLAMTRLLENVKSEHWRMQGYSWTWEYPRALWETIILSFGSLFLLYSYSSKHCQHVWLPKEKGHCIKRRGRA